MGIISQLPIAVVPLGILEDLALVRVAGVFTACVRSYVVAQDNVGCVERSGLGETEKKVIKCT